ncbi:MAG: hypothetical protein V1736_13300 [Pseudomonadota bacterium]
MDREPVFVPNGLPTLVGSLPLKDHVSALDMMLKYVPEIPLWIQLPSYPEEGLLLQFSESLPGIAIKDQSAFFDTGSPGFDEEVLAFYEEYLAVSESAVPFSQSRFALGPKTGMGFRAFIERIECERKPSALKGQITGPFTFLTGINDQNKRCAFYDERLRDIVVKALALKAAWQVAQLKRFNLPVLISIDEPGLAGYGSSAFISISRKDVVEMLSPVAEAIQTAGGLAGVHVCANTDWSLLTDSGINIISFDAYNYFDRFVLYRKEILSFLARGGIIAWGMIPTANPEDIRKETAPSLARQWEDAAGSFVEGQLSLKDLLRQSLITPSCGTGALSPELSERVLQLTREVSNQLRKDLL